MLLQISRGLRPPSRCATRTSVLSRTSASRPYFSLAPAIDRVWPPEASSAEIVVKRAAAIHLATKPDQNTCSAVASAVTSTAGTVKQLGIKQSFKQLLSSDPCFVVSEGDGETQPLLRLNIARLQHTGDGSSTLPSAQQLLQHVYSTTWHHTNPQLDVLGRAVAAHLVATANADQLARGDVANADPSSYEMTSSQAAMLMSRVWEENFPGQAKCYGKVAKALEGNEYFTTFLFAPSQQGLQLDTVKLLQDMPGQPAQEQHEQQGEGRQPHHQQLQPPVSSVPQHTSVSALQLLQHVQRRTWHDSNQHLDVARRAMAAHMVVAVNTRQLAGLSQGVNLDPTCYQLLGTQAADVMRMAWKRGLLEPYSSKRLLRILEGDECLSVVCSSAGGLFVQLDVQHAVQEMATRTHAASQSAPASTAGSALEALTRQHNPAQQQQRTHTVSAQRLLQYVERRCWHDSNQQLDVALRALAVRIVMQANEGRLAQADQANHDFASYVLTGHEAGSTMRKAVEHELTGQLWCFQGITDPLADTPLFSTFMSGPTTMSVQLEIHQLLDEISTGITTQLSKQPLQPALQPRHTVLLPVSALPPAGSLSAVTAADCAAADVVIVSELRQHPQLQRHIQAAGLIGLDVEYGVLADGWGQPTAPCSTDSSTDDEDDGSQAAGGQSGHSSSSSRSNRQLPELPLQWNRQQLDYQALMAANPRVVALLQLFVPAAASSESPEQQWPAQIYIIEVPEQAAAAQQVLEQLRAVLEDEQLVKVMHDARQDSFILQRQFGIRLKGVLDTQLLAGLTAFGAACGPGSSGSSSGSSSSTWGASLRRVGIDDLYRLYRYPHPAQACSRSGPRFWFSRPLPSRAVQYAADDVRYLLPLAYNLLELLPAGLVHLSDLQLLLAQQGAAALQLKPELLHEYVALLTSIHNQHQLDAASSDSSGSNSSSGSSGSRGSRGSIPEALEHAAAAAGLPGLLQVQFELQLLPQPGGYYVPSYGLFLHEEQQHDGAAADTVPQGDDGDSSNSNSKESSLSQTEACEAAGAGLSIAAPAGDGSQGVLNEAGESILQLLPDSVAPYLLPHLTVSPGQPLVTHILADAGHNMQLKLSDRSLVELPCILDIPDALARVAAAKQRQQQQQQLLAGSMLCSSSSVRDATAAAAEVSSSQPAASDAAAVSNAYADLFVPGRRLRVPGTLHHLSALRDLAGQVIGLTYHLGRHIPGVALMLADVLSSMKASVCCPGLYSRPQSLLLLGRPGVGKTTLMRDIARLMSLTPEQGGLGLAVAVVDTFGEIAGDCQHHIGSARCIPVQQRQQQAAVLLDVLHQHAPDVILVDDLATEQEVAAAHAIAEQGVLLVAAASSSSLVGLLQSAELHCLVGGVQEAQEATQWLHRGGLASFANVLELQDKDRWRLHLDAESSVNALLAAQPPASTLPQHLQQQQQYVHAQLRIKHRFAQPGRVVVQFETPEAAAQALDAAAAVATAAGTAGVRAAFGGSAHPSITQTAESAAHGGSSRQKQAFSGGWMVDLLHAAVHRSIEYAANVNNG